MTIERAKELMEIERECVKRNEAGCDRDCAKCALAQQTNELIAAYDRVISYINSAFKFYGG